MTEPTAPLVWRVPPWQAGLAYLIAAIAAALAVYGPFSSFPRIIAAVVAVLVAFLATVAARAFLVVDADGLGWRRLVKETSVPWSQVERLEVVRGIKGNRPALLVWREGVGRLEIPPTLVQPTLPVTAATLMQRLHGIARSIEDYGAAYGYGPRSS